MGRGGTSLLWSSGETESRAVFGFFYGGDSAARIIEIESGRIGDCVGCGVDTSDVASMVDRYLLTCVFTHEEHTHALEL